MAVNQTVYDVDAEEKISNVLLTLLNTYPGLDTGVIEFARLSETSGIGFFPSSSPVMLIDNHYITGWVYQRCRYSFDVIYRSAPQSDAQKIRVKEFLDGLGRWLEQQPVSINETSYKLETYPEIESGARKIRKITRVTPAFMMTANPNGIQDWAISLEMIYQNNYFKE